MYIYTYLYIYMIYVYIYIYHKKTNDCMVFYQNPANIVQWQFLYLAKYTE